MTITHCLPTGALGTAEIPVCGVNAGTVTISDPGAGNRRGFFVFFHGLNAGNVPSFPQPVPNSGTNGFYTRYGDFEGLVVTDNWVFVYPSVNEDFYSPASSIVGLYNDVSADTGHGSRFLASALHEWDHIMTYLAVAFSLPVSTVISLSAVGGVSMGGWRALQIAANRPVLGYMSHCGATIFENVAPGFTPPETFSNIVWSGMNLSTTFMNAVTAPGIIGYGTNDTAVGYNLAGTGGTPVSNTDSIITNAVAASRPLTRNATADTHEFCGTAVTTPAAPAFDSTVYSGWVHSTLNPLAPVSF